MSQTLPIADSANDGFEVESRLRLELDGPVDVPRIDSLFELEQLCQTCRTDVEFWRVIAVGAAYALCGNDWADAALESEKWLSAIAALKARRYRD